MNNILEKNGIDHSIELITNEDFDARIVQPVLNKLVRKIVINDSILESGDILDSIQYGL